MKCENRSRPLNFRRIWIQFFFIVTSNLKYSLYLKSFPCEEAKNKQHTSTKYFVKSVRKWYGNPDSHASYSTFNNLQGKPVVCFNISYCLKTVRMPHSVRISYNKTQMCNKFKEVFIPLLQQWFSQIHTNHLRIFWYPCSWQWLIAGSVQL